MALRPRNGEGEGITQTLTLSYDVVPSWELYYISYDRLKELLLQFRTGQFNLAHMGLIRRDYYKYVQSFEKRFLQALEVECSKINGFFKVTASQLSNQMRNISKIAIREGRKPVSWQDLSQELDLFQGILVNLSMYTATNFALVRKMVRKHDKYTGLMVYPWYFARLIGQPFASNSTEFARLLLEFNQTCSICRGAPSSPWSVKGGRRVKQKQRLDDRKGKAEAKESSDDLIDISSWPSAADDRGEVLEMPESPLAKSDTDLNDVVEVIPGGYVRLKKRTKGVSQKFFVSPSDVIRTKVAIARVCPMKTSISAFVESSVDPSSGRDSARSEITTITPEMAEKHLSSSQRWFCYLDNPDTFDLYECRAGGKQDAEMIRIRFESKLADCVDIEKKVYLTGSAEEDAHEHLTMGFPVPEGDLADFMTGEYTIEQYKMWLTMSGEDVAEQRRYVEWFGVMQSDMITRKLQPVMTTSFLRSSFHFPGDESVILTIEENIHLFNEVPRLPVSYEKAEEKAEVWRRLLRDYHFRKSASGLRFDPGNCDAFNSTIESYSFPFALLTVTLGGDEQGEPRKPSWLGKLLRQDHLQRVQHFSKAEFAIAVFNRPTVRTTPVWVLEFLAQNPSTDLAKGGKRHKSSGRSGDTRLLILDSKVRSKGVRKDKSVKRMKSKKNVKSLEFKPMSEEERLAEKAYFTFPSLGERLLCALTNNYPPVEVHNWSKAFIEPKTFLANERVFCHWMKKVILLNAYGGHLFNQSFQQEGRYADYCFSVALLLLAAVSLVYAFVLFRWRAKKIHRYQIVRPDLDRYSEEWFYDDNVGPFLFFTSLFFLSLFRFYTFAIENEIIHHSYS